MKRWIFLAVPLAIAFSVLLTAAPTPPVASADSGVVNVTVTGPEAHAEWMVGEGTCHWTHVVVDLWQHSGIGTEGPLAPKTTVEITTNEANQCGSPWTSAGYQAWGEFPKDIYTAHGTGLDSTRLVGRLPIVFGYPKPLEYMDVDLVWTGTGDATRIKGRDMQVEKGGLLYMCHWIVRQRDAVASGQILIDGTNVVPDPSSSASLGKADPSSCVFLPE